MNTSLIEIHDEAILQKGIKTLTDSYLAMAIDSKQSPGLVAVVTGCGSPFLNVVIDSRPHQENSADLIPEFKQFFSAHNVPWAWMVTPIANNNDFEKYDLKFLETTPSMYFDLTSAITPIDKSSLAIREVLSVSDFPQWIEPLNEGFPSNDNGERFRDLNAMHFQNGVSTLRHFMGFHQNEVVVSGTLFLADDSVILHSIATKTAFQRQGFGAALTSHLMQVAQDEGCRHCFLDSSEDGFNLYKKLGFKTYGLTKFYQLNTLPKQE